MSHKGEKMGKLSVKRKLEAIDRAKVIGNRKAAAEMNLDESRIRDWRKKEAGLKEMAERAGSSGGTKRFRLDGAGRRVTSFDLEKDLVTYIETIRSENKRVTQQMIKREALRMFQYLQEQGLIPPEVNFRASKVGT